MHKFSLAQAGPRKIDVKISEHDTSGLPGDEEHERGSAILHALRARRSVPRMLPKRPDRRLVEGVIEAAGWAPNHYKTEPWQFLVLAGAARNELGEAMAQVLSEKLDPVRAEERMSLLERERVKPLRAPVVIVLAVVPSERPKVVENEEIAAGAAAAQNMLLAAEALGMSAMWRTGPAAYHPLVKRHLGLPDVAHIIAFVYLGYVDREVTTPTRSRNALKRASWLGWEDSTPSSRQ